MYEFFIGIDVSKSVLDIVVRDWRSVHFHICIDNTPTGLRSFSRRLHEEGIEQSKCLICLEHTGVYNLVALDYLHDCGFALWLENPMQIKRSMGLTRGKNDRLDAERICEYAFRYQDKMRLWEPEREVITEIRHLTAMRRRLILAKNQLKVPVNEGQGRLGNKLQKELELLSLPAINKLDQQIKQVDSAIKVVIERDNILRRLFELVTSVASVGPVLACEILVTSNEFRSFTNPKKYACYAGVVPFEHSSGSSIKGRHRVSSLSNQSLKKLLHMSAMSSVSREGELRDFYRRKVAEGKNKMSVLNAVRNKIIQRVFACVRDGREYEKTYAHSLA